jgi:hypothetical protein
MKCVCGIKQHEWEARFSELKAQNMTYHEVCDILHQEGFKTFKGKKITVDTLRGRIGWLRKKQKQIS